jgi:peptidase C25-like protein/CARDB protein
MLWGRIPDPLKPLREALCDVTFPIRLWIISLGLMAWAIPLSAAPAGGFIEGLSETRTELLIDSAEEIRVRHQWAEESPLRVDRFLAIPAEEQPEVRIEAWHLTELGAGDSPRTLVFDDPETVPEQLGRQSSAISLQTVGFARHTRLARLVIHPRTVNIEDDEARWQITGYEAVIDVSAASPEAESVPDPIGRPLIEDLVLNPGGVARWAIPDPPLPPDVREAQWRPTVESDRWVRLMVGESGPVRVERRSLVEAGVNRRQVDLSRVAVYHHGVALPTWVSEDGERLFVVVASVAEPHSAQTALWLDLRGEGEPLRIEAVTSVAPTPEEQMVDPWLEAVIEEDGPSLETSLVEALPSHLPAQYQPDRPRSIWTWEELVLDEPQFISVPPLRGEPGVATSVGEAALRVVADQGTRGSLTHVEILASPEGSVSAPLRPTIHLVDVTAMEMSAEALLGPTLTLTPRSDTERTQRTGRSRRDHRVFLDAVVLRRPVTALLATPESPPLTLVPSSAETATVDLPEFTLAFDVNAEPPALLVPRSSPTPGLGRLTLRGDEWRVVVAAPEAFPEPAEIALWSGRDLTSGELRADMVIITDRDLAPAAFPLAVHHTLSGLAVELVFTDEIYDSHGEGVPGPDAIRAFLADAFRHWSPPAPAYVTLLGDCSRDFAGVWRSGVVDHVPTFSEPNPMAREVHWEASDLRHTLVAGEDSLADLFLGRLSAPDLPRASALVRKVISYATEAPLGPWRMRAGMMADDDRVSSRTFDEMSEEVRAESMSPAMRTARIYLREMALVNNPFIPEELLTRTNEKVSPAATTAIRAMFDHGAVLATYYGHGGPNLWADERIWFACDSPNSDNLLLGESRQLPFLINMTCSSGAIDFPDEFYHICISEDFMLSEGGAIACYVPTGEGMPSQHQRLMHAIMRGIWEDGQRRLGEIVTAAGWRFILESRTTDLVEHFALLGDPALALALPQWIRPLSPAPRALAAGVRHDVEVDLHPQHLVEAEGVAWLIGPLGEAVEERPLRHGTATAASPERFTIPGDAQEGRWTAAAMWWSEAQGFDEMVYEVFTVSRPRAALESWSVADIERPVAAGDEITVTAHVLCESAVPTGPLTLEVIDLAASGEAQRLAGATLSLAPGESRSVPLTWSGSVGLMRLALRAGGDPERWTDESHVVMDEPTALAVIDPAGPASLITSQSHLALLRESGSAESLEALEVTVGHIGSGEIEQAQVSVMSGDGLRALSPPKDLIAPPRAGATVVVRLDGPETVSLPLSSEVQIRIDWTSAKGERGTARVPVVLAEPLPDLMIAAEPWALRPADPSEGETLLVDCVVVNRGEAAAGAFYVLLERESGQRLRSRTEARPDEIPSLRAGESRSVTLRWDPTHETGEQAIHVVVDGEEAVVESDESNNTLVLSAAIRTAEDVRFTRAVGWHDVRVDPPSITLTSQISNFGESDGRDYVITWYADQGRTERIGETQIDVIGAGATLPVEHRWEMSPEHAERQRTGEALSPTCDLGVRSGMRRVFPEEGLEPGAGG